MQSEIEGSEKMIKPTKGLRIYSGAELMAMPLPDNVRVDRQAGTLDIYGIGGHTKEDPYWWSLSRLTTWRGWFELIGHVGGKSWATPDLVYQLEQAGYREMANRGAIE